VLLHRLVPLIAGSRPARFPRWPLPVRAARARTRAFRRPGRKQPGHGRNSPRSKPENDFHCEFHLTFSMPLVVPNRDIFAILHNVLTK